MTNTAVQTDKRAAYPAYKPSGVSWLGDVPKHWSVAAIKRFAHFQSGDGITSLEIEPEGEFPVYGGNGLRGYTSKYTHDGDFVLLGRQGALCGNVNYASGKFWASEHAVVITPSKKICLHWYGELLRAMNLGQYSMSAAQPGLSVQFVINLQAPIPPFDEQRQIAAFLDRETAKIDALIAKKERLIGLLQEKRTALISHAVTKGLDPNVPMKDSGVEWVQKIPAHWSIVALKRFAHFQSGDGITSLDIASEGKFPVYGGNGLRGYTSKYTHDGDFVLLGRQGALCGNVNYASGKFWASEHAVVVTPSKKTCLRWYGELLRAMNLGQYSMSAAQPGLSVQFIVNLQAPVPPLGEQHQIVAFLDREAARIDALVSKIREAIEKLREYRTALISAAVTGKIDVREEIES